MVSFAYSGAIEIDSGTVEDIYLLACMLKCKKLMNWSFEYLKTR